MPLLTDNPLEFLPSAAPVLILLLAACIVGRFAERAAPRFNVSRTVIADLTPALAVVAIVAARLTTAVPHWRMVMAHPLDLLRVNGQLPLLGGVIGVVVGLGILTRRSRLPVCRIADAYGAAVPLGFAVQGLGCLLRDDCYGRAAPPPLGIVFPGLREPRYPVALYAAAAALFCYVGLRWVSGRRPPPGTVALAAVAALAAGEGLFAPLRLEADMGSPSPRQIVSLSLAALAMVLLQLRLLRSVGPGPSLVRFSSQTAVEPTTDVGGRLG